MPVHNAKTPLELKRVIAGTLEIGYVESGPVDGWPVVLSHGFPYDVHAYDEVTPLLTKHGARTIVPYLRGFGATRFLHATTFRSGQQAALGQDIINLLDALGIEHAILAGYDWGGLASCVASLLWPDRVSGLVSLASYDVIDIERQKKAFSPDLEHVMWYQHLFQTERGRDCLVRYREDVCRMLWQEWSPHWNFNEQTFAQTATSYANPDFVDVVIHSYRFDFGLAAGDPALEALEQRLTLRSPITVPAVTLDGAHDPLKPGGTADQAHMFSSRHEHRTINCGHNLPQEAPEAFADAILTLHSWTKT